MKHLFFLLNLVALTMSSQVYQTGTITVTFNDPLRTGGYGSGAGPGRQIQTEVYYPATISGSNVAVASGTFPVVVVGHGFVMDWQSYDNIYSQLSKRGYIVALPRTEGSFSPNHADFGADLALVGVKMLQLNTTNTVAPIFTGKVLQKVAIGGHSMGGGSSFLGASNNSTLTSLFNFAAAQTNPRSSQSAKTVTVPTLIIGGEKDCVAPIAANQSVMWDSTASLNKFNINIKNLTHCDFGNGTNFNCVFGQNSSGCSSTVTNTLATAAYMNFLNPFLDATLKGDCVAANRFMDSVNLSQVIFSKKLLGTLICSSTGIFESPNEGSIFIYPNPSDAYLTLKGEIKGSTIRLISVNGQVIYSKNNLTADEFELNVSDYPRGVYILESEHNNRVVRKKILLQ